MQQHVPFPIVLLPLLLLLSVGASVPAQPPTITEVLQDFRNTAVLYDLRYDFNGETLTGGDPAHKENYPFPDSWPTLVTYKVVTKASDYKKISGDGVGYDPTVEGGFAFPQKMERGICNTNTQSLLFLQGIGSKGGVVSSGYCNLFVNGEMAGTINHQTYSTTVIRCDVTGRIRCGSYANLVVYGTMRGKMALINSANAYLLGGIEGALESTRGAKILIGGKTTEAALSRVRGTAHLFLEESDLPVGTHERQDVTITVLGKSLATLGQERNAKPTVVAPVGPAVPRHLKPFYEGPDVKDVADFPNHDLRAGGNPDMRYSVLGPGPAGKTPPQDGYRLLLILPGGEGSPDFNPFLRRVAKNALSGEFLVVQLVAPVWDETQGAKLVWPTRTSPYAKMKFATEDFIEAVVVDVGKTHKINSKCVYALGWSSGGPPVYASLLSEKSPLTGAFVAMSVFQPTNLPPLTGAKGKAVYLLHSPQDFIKIAQAETARDQLAMNGATTTLTTYPGGHGWREDPFGHIARGTTWLVEQTTKK